MITNQNLNRDYYIIYTKKCKKFYKLHFFKSKREYDRYY